MHRMGKSVSGINYSKGALADIAVLSLAAGVLQVIVDIENGERSVHGVIEKNPDRDLAEKMHGLYEEIIRQYRKIYGRLTAKQRHIVKLKQYHAFKVFISEAPEHVQLDLLAIYLMQQRFMERDKPLHHSLVWFMDCDLYDGIRDLTMQSLEKSMDRKEAEEQEGRMFEAACRIAGMI